MYTCALKNTHTTHTLYRDDSLTSGPVFGRRRLTDLFNELFFFFFFVHDHVHAPNISYMRSISIYYIFLVFGALFVMFLDTL